MTVDEGRVTVSMTQSADTNLRISPLTHCRVMQNKGSLWYIADKFKVTTRVGGRKLFKDLSLWKPLNPRSQMTWGNASRCSVPYLEDEHCAQGGRLDRCWFLVTWTSPCLSHDHWKTLGDGYSKQTWGGHHGDLVFEYDRLSYAFIVLQRTTKRPKTSPGKKRHHLLNARKKYIRENNTLNNKSSSRPPTRCPGSKCFTLNVIPNDGLAGAGKMPQKLIMMLTYSSPARMLRMTAASFSSRRTGSSMSRYMKTRTHPWAVEQAHPHDDAVESCMWRDLFATEAVPL
ncbi:uncharacterized protein MCYG_04697 [Microsporum canis CBS 113480]|uniref:Uncharacterized protein n=1 Tax=Arthroderma otae (strain ATCC MYA-4605 / CBS 113480) TaxID=554155 RepID=C5FP25_ARTOC|nr:uncharacterized protein MCYG_04697 [Microsporum canis CBS 113480]EEQ31878.1 hypothetical protein MCYG_04697 [Microsporum canis CBS 113480]